MTPHNDCLKKLQELIGCACIGDALTSQWIEGYWEGHADGKEVVMKPVEPKLPEHLSENSVSITGLTKPMPEQPEAREGHFEDSERYAHLEASKPQVEVDVEKLANTIKSFWEYCPNDVLDELARYIAEHKQDWVK